MSACSAHTHHRCVDRALTRAAALCTQHGLRLTPLRRQVLVLVWESHRPAKAYDILTKLQRHEPAAKPPTVYRALDFLLDNGLIHKLHRKNAYIGCAHPQQGGACFFLICTQCNTVTEGEDPTFAQFVQHATQAYGFVPHHTTFEVEGLCGNCSAGTQAAAR